MIFRLQPIRNLGILLFVAMMAMNVLSATIPSGWLEAVKVKYNEKENNCTVQLAGGKWEINKPLDKSGKWDESGWEKLSGNELKVEKGKRYGFMREEDGIAKWVHCPPPGILVTVGHFANDIGKVVSNLPGIECTANEGENCKKFFYIDDIMKATPTLSEIKLPPLPPGVTPPPADAKMFQRPKIELTATPLTGTETGNHFVAWEIIEGEEQLLSEEGDEKYKKYKTKNTISIDPLGDYFGDSLLEVKVKAVFKIERCYGAVGAGCSFQHDDICFDEVNRKYWECDPYSSMKPQPEISVGSILHDRCCVEYPRGHKCGLDDSEPDKCRDEWDRAEHTFIINLVSRQYQWKPDPKFPTYPPNIGDDLSVLQSPPGSLPNQLKAPKGIKLKIGEEGYCRSGKLSPIDNKEGYGICD